MTTFGKLESVSIRDGWPREDTGFTRWLAEEENLSALGDELCIPLELVETESGVGSYRLDILARRVDSDESVVIENQFGSTDHGHLGQLLTYASGVGADGTGARTIVWIAERFTEPHRAALDWLNKSTEPGIRFFGVEIQLWRIGDSPYAPKFNIVSRPNDWQKQLTQETAVLTETSQLYQEFWKEFITFCEREHTSLKLPSSPPSRWWLFVPIGRVGFHVSLNAVKKFKRLECQLWVAGPQAKTEFRELLLSREKIVAELGDQVGFDENAPNRCKIYETSVGDITNREEWPQIHSWLKERGERYVSVLTPLVQQLKLH
ncbi:DUF4268 domain-containing protein [Granulicella sp. dw_53]|uniref:DUF4268 domain-containing protein n=1 Tax=Granulicella sp. dw_53 TaxID=2719792 RepID=UPI001BD57D0D|nr:DUF4268 domain-containing protein [Granulicella sp. dw_53]